jgi:hypothetical protein
MPAADPRTAAEYSSRASLIEVNQTDARNMIWFVVESGLALALLIFIVWWTMPRGKKDKDPGERR